MDSPDRYVFTITYEDAVMKAAARTFVTRGLFHGRQLLVWIAIGCVGTYAVILVATGDRTFMAGILLALFAAIPLLAITAWWMHWRSMRSKLELMEQRVATVRLSDDGISFEADSGTAKLPWRAIKDVWRTEQAWLFVLAANQFVTLPLRDIDPAALAFITAKVTPVSL